MTGRKFDGDKPRWSLIPKRQLVKVVQVLTFGSRKYEDNNWMKVDNARDRYYSAAKRHIDDWWNGEFIDPDSGLPHLAHAACCLLFLMWFDDEDNLANPHATPDKPVEHAEHHLIYNHSGFTEYKK